MDRMGYKEGDVIQAPMITRAIERAQKKVEENHFGVRKRLLEYDDVMNAQREVIYKKRKHALYGDRLSLDIANMMYDTVENLVSEFRDSRDPRSVCSSAVPSPSSRTPSSSWRICTPGPPPPSTWCTPRP